jgi:hypothetical protein
MQTAHNDVVPNFMVLLKIDFSYVVAAVGLLVLDIVERPLPHLYSLVFFVLFFFTVRVLINIVPCLGCIR